MNDTGIAIVVLFGTALAAGLARFVLFDRIVQQGYKLHRRSWEPEGKPHGMFWFPEETTTPFGFIRLKSSNSSRRLFHRLAWSTPEWVKRDVVALRMLWLFRVIFWSLKLGCVAIILLTLR